MYSHFKFSSLPDQTWKQTHTPTMMRSLILALMLLGVARGAEEEDSDSRLGKGWIMNSGSIF